MQLVPVSNKLYAETTVGHKHLKQWQANWQAKLTTDVFGNSSRSEHTQSPSYLTLLQNPLIYRRKVNKSNTVTTIVD